MKARSAKNKGKRLQNYVRDRLLEKYPTLEPDDIRSTGMGQQGEDLQLSPAARRILPYAIECKNLARIAVYNYYAQAKEHAGVSGLNPLVVIKQDREKPLVVLDFDYFLELL